MWLPPNHANHQWVTRTVGSRNSDRGLLGTASALVEIAHLSRRARVGARGRGAGRVAALHTQVRGLTVHYE